MVSMILGPSAIGRELRDRFEPLSEIFYGDVYRGAAKVKGGIYLPCVAFFNRQTNVELKLKRLRESSELSPQFEQTVEIFCTWGSRVDISEVVSVDPSPLALSSSQIGQIGSETGMGWTSFVGEMSDGSRHNFRTTHYHYFFDMPQGYAAKDIVKIHSHLVVLENGEMIHAQQVQQPLERFNVHRGISHFECYITDL
jgi:hypothetical protein